MIFANRTLPHSHPYRRYLENRLRERLQLHGIPVRLVIRARTSAPSEPAWRAESERRSTRVRRLP